METALVLVPLFLLAGAVACGTLALAGLRKPRLDDRWIGILGCLGPAAAFVVSVALFADLDRAGGRIATTLFDWFGAGDLWIELDLAVDALTCVMLLVVTGVGSLIHVYSIGYMKGDPGIARYFACLNLFTFFMTVLVLAADLVVLFVGWEGVGLCSYLLIGFWWRDEEKAKAGLKAFVVNRIGDAGFILGMLLIWRTAGTLEIQELAAWIGTPEGREAMLASSGFLGASVATMVGTLLFFGATGKSAQIPLYVWLPDAMAGPTPVSALIHAATMVTAGVYMVARLNFVYALSPFAQGVILVVAGLTSLLAGLMAIAQFDIKKVLAYSTISQIGYMMVGVGTGYIGAGMFHVVTHAFFKAALFLGAGSIIAMSHHEQDMRRMGGLARRMPLTCATMTLAAAAMAGVPPLSGFFSKDEVLWRAFSSGSFPGVMAWFLGIVTAGITAFYMFRLIFLTFAGSFRGHHPPHEAPPVMTVPQGLLALGAVVVGFLGVPHILGGHDRFGAYVRAIVPEWAAPSEGEHAIAVSVEWALMVWSVIVGVAGIFAAWWCYIRRPQLPAQMAARWPDLYGMIASKFRVDETYSRIVVEPTERAARRLLSERVDGRIIEGVINGLGRWFRNLGHWLSRLQAGLVRGYVALMIAGLLLLLLTLLV